MSDHSHSDSPKAKAEIPQGNYRRGFNTFIALAVLTAIEFVAGSEDFVAEPSAVLLILLAVAKAALVMNVFMGITKLWRGGDHH